jgi:hypothetical protein
MSQEKNGSRIPILYPLCSYRLRKISLESARSSGLIPLAKVNI